MWALGLCRQGQELNTLVLEYYKKGQGRNTLAREPGKQERGQSKQAEEARKLMDWRGLGSRTLQGQACQAEPRRPLRDRKE